MQFSISSNGTQTGQERGRDVSGVSICVQDSANTTGANITNALLQGVLVNVTLQRGGQNYTVMAGNLYALGISGYPSSFEGLNIAGTSNSQKAFLLDFGEIINLQGEDILTVQVQTTGFAATMTTTVDTINGTGVGQYIPRVIAFTVDQNQSQQPFQLGDNVSCISYVSDSATLIKCTAINVTSDGRYTQQLTAPTYYGLIASQWERTPEGLQFQIYNGAPLDGVVVTTNNVANAANTWIVSYSGVIDSLTLNRANASAKNLLADAAVKLSPTK